MLNAALEQAAGCQVAFCTAAVADFRPANPYGEKIKRQARSSLELNLEACPDILQSLIARHNKMRVIGFAAETNDVDRNAQNKRDVKGAYAIVANDVSRPDIGFDTDENEVSIHTSEGVTRLDFAPKLEIAHRLLDLLVTDIR